MRHRVKTTRFGRTASQRSALMAALVSSLIMERRISTTLAKARAARSLAEKMTTLAKTGTLAARRRVLQTIRNKKAVQILFADLAPNYKDRAGGYCRIVKSGQRRSDASAMAVLEWVGLSQVDRKKKEKAEEKKQA